MTRRTARRAYDNYPTPPWCVRRLLEVSDIPDRGRWLEPCAGSGSIIEAVNSRRKGIKWIANDIRHGCRRGLSSLIGEDNVFIGDFLSDDHPLLNRHFDVVFTNPPFKDAIEFIRRSQEIADWVVMLARLDFLASRRRAEFMRNHMPDVFILPDRPSFTGLGQDMHDYGWFVWHQGKKRNGFRKRSKGRIMVLDPTDRDERLPRNPKPKRRRARSSRSKES